MQIPEYASKVASSFQKLLFDHENIIFTHESFKYKIDDALKSLEFDESGITAMVAMKLQLSLLASCAFIKISAFTNDFDQINMFNEEYKSLLAQVKESGVDDKIQDMSDSIQKYLMRNKQYALKEKDLDSFLQNPSQVADVYTKSFKSLKDFDVLTFNKGENAVAGIDLELFSPIYLWRDFNSLQTVQSQLTDGVYFCFVDCVFGFLYKNGENVVLISDHLEYNHNRKFLNQRTMPTNKNKVDAGFYLPYQLLKKDSGKLDLTFYNANNEGYFANQETPSLLCNISELPISTLVYVVLMFELIVKKYAFNPDELKDNELTTSGMNFTFTNQIEYKTNKSFITVDQVKSDSFLTIYPEQSYIGLNTRLEDLFYSKVDPSLLNLVKHNNQVYRPDQTGKYVPYNELVKYPNGESPVQEVLKLFAFDLTMIGTVEQLEEVRFRVARKNYAALIDMHAKIFMHEQLPKVRKYLKNKFEDNLENIEKILGLPSFSTEKNGKSWDFMVSEEYDLKKTNYPRSLWLRTTLCQSSPGSSVKKCYETGAKRHQTITFNIKNAEQLSLLLNEPFNKLPLALRLYYWSSPSHHCLNDPLDALCDIWETRLIQFEVIVSKSHYRTLKQLAEPDQLIKFNS
ncbi:TPA: hypothetical protein ACGIK9_002832 [Acinetobacter baumannii]|uniref:hypothetical protein n=1 Tax=Acinetobacter baumannii TaxID=470 RepID=UPI00338ED130